MHRHASHGKLLVRSTLFSLLLIAGAPAGWAIDFKGIEIGQPLWRSAERSVFGEIDCNPTKLSPTEYARYVEEMQTVIPGVRKVCSSTTSIATVPADATVLLGSSRRVLRLTFQFAGEEYSRVVTAMEMKWGEGIVEVRDEQDMSTWWDFEEGVTVSAHLMPVEAPGDDTPYSVGLVEYSIGVMTPEADL